MVWAVRRLSLPTAPLDTYQFLLVVMIYLNSFLILFVTQDSP